VRITDRVYLVGSGAVGFDLTDAFDCHVFLVDGGGELALLDVGAGMGAEAIVANVREHGFEPEAVRHVVLTHAHGDHAGGAARMRELLPGATFYAHPTAAGWVRAGDEEGTSVAPAKVAGIYPLDYVLRPAEVDEEVVEGDRIRVGELELQVYETPGHADGLVSLLLDAGGTRTLFSSDAVFWGGHILMQQIHDCRLDAQIATLRKLRGLAVDALFPGHLAFSLRDGQRHIERANDALDRLLPPNQLFDAW
jgi:glyoxylase-like metal-dependent hydrolase (beta-lactamase superfamily II)